MKRVTVLMYILWEGGKIIKVSEIVTLQAGVFMWFFPETKTCFWIQILVWNRKILLNCIFWRNLKSIDLALCRLHILLFHNNFFFVNYKIFLIYFVIWYSSLVLLWFSRFEYQTFFDYFEYSILVMSEK